MVLCTASSLRTSASSLGPTHVGPVCTDYYFFTFTRDPIKRFFSGYLQNLVEKRRVHKSSLYTYEAVSEQLSRIEDRSCGFNVHLESMTMSLSSPVMRPGSMVPMDFIGDISQLVPGFFAMLKAAGRTLAPELESRVRKLLAAVETHGLAHSSARLAHVRNASLDARVREVYAQDFVCFGYK